MVRGGGGGFGEVCAGRDVYLFRSFLLRILGTFGFFISFMVTTTGRYDSRRVTVPISKDHLHL